jgi:hypothetical protein
VLNLVQHADLIWFSFEEPDSNEAHYHHCNEQPAPFWRNLFSFYDYSMQPLPTELSESIEGRGRFICYSNTALSLPEEVSTLNWPRLEEQIPELTRGTGDSTTKKIVKLICPPFIWHLLMRLKDSVDHRDRNMT